MSIFNDHWKINTNNLKFCLQYDNPPVFPGLPKNTLYLILPHLKHLDMSENVHKGVLMKSGLGCSF